MSRPTHHTFTGAPTAANQKKDKFSQASTRRLQFHYDQHGRRWWSTVEIRSGMPVGQIEPTFRAPWYPDQKFLIVNPDNAIELYIDYRTMAAERNVAETEYFNAAVQLANDKKWDIPKRGDYPSEIIEALGRPTRSLRLVVAAWQGNPWMLGTSETPDPRLAALVEAEKPKFLIDPAQFESMDFGPESYAAETGVAEPKGPPRSVRPRDMAFGASPEDAAFAELGGAQASTVIGDGEDVSVPKESAEGDEDVEQLLDAIDAEDDEDDDDLDAEHDPAGLGGRTVAPGNLARVQRRAPAPPGATPSKNGKKANPRPTLADGAAPVVGS